MTDLLLTFLLTIISDRELCFGFNNVLFPPKCNIFLLMLERHLQGDNSLIWKNKIMKSGEMRMGRERPTSSQVGAQGQEISGCIGRRGGGRKECREVKFRQERNGAREVSRVVPDPLGLGSFVASAAFIQRKVSSSLQSFSNITPHLSWWPEKVLTSPV